MRGWTAFGLAVAAVLALAWWAPWVGADAAPDPPPAEAEPAVGEAPDTDPPAGADLGSVAVDREDLGASPAAEAPAAPKYGELIGRLVVAEGEVDPYTWDVELTGPGRRWPYTVKLAADGSFRVDKLRPGSFTATALREGMRVSRVEGLEVVAGETLRDPRLDPWRPDEGMRTMRLRIAGEPGQRGDTNVWALGPGDSHRGHADWVGDEHLLYTGPAESPDALIHAPGYRPLRLPWRDGVVEVELEQGIEVQLRAAAPVALDEGILAAWCLLSPEDGILGVDSVRCGVEFPAQRLAAGETVTLRVPVAGRYALYFAGNRQEGPGFIPLYRDPVQRGLMVDDAPGQELVVVLPDPLGAED